MGTCALYSDKLSVSVLAAIHKETSLMESKSFTDLPHDNFYVSSWASVCLGMLGCTICNLRKDIGSSSPTLVTICIFAIIVDVKRLPLCRLI